MTILLAIGGVVLAVIIAVLLIYFRAARYDDAVERIVEAAVSRQHEKEQGGFARMPERHRIIAIEQRCIRIMLQKKMKLPPDLAERVKARLTS